MFTKGPWIIDKAGTDCIENMADCLLKWQPPEHQWIAVGIEDKDGYAESVAYCHPRNANLIVKAPEMYDLLSEMVDGLKEDHEATMRDEGDDEKAYHENDCSLCRQLREAEEILKEIGGGE